MQAELQSSFQRVEQALQRFTDSIAAYNPSTTAADELAAADDAVNEDLKKLVVHQRNYQRIEELRRQTDAYDADLKNKIRQLSETRKELINIPAYNPSDDSIREINVGELLRYAKFISKNSVPPTLPKTPPPPPPNQEVKQINGTSTPPPDSVQDQSERPKEGMSAMERIDHDKTREWLATTRQFEVWPEWPTMAKGALADIQRMVEAGQDPAAVLSAEEAERKELEDEAERERMEREEEEKWREQQARAAARGSGGMRRRETVEEVFNPDEM